jgi:hypothetical protein
MLRRVSCYFGKLDVEFDGAVEEKDAEQKKNIRREVPFFFGLFLLASAILSVVLIGAAVGAAVGPLDCSRRPPVRALRHLSYQSKHILPLPVIFSFRVATRSPDETAESTIIIVLQPIRIMALPSRSQKMKTEKATFRRINNINRLFPATTEVFFLVPVLRAGRGNALSAIKRSTEK